MDLSIVIVSYNTRGLLKECLDSIRGTSGVSYEIVVVDNASADGSAGMVKEYYPDIRLIENDRNVGFAAANNQGIRESRGRYILLLNSDTRVTLESLAQTARFAESTPDAGVVGCRVLNGDGSLQYSCFHFPSLATEAAYFTKNIVIGGWDPFIWYRNMSYWDYGTARRVDCVSGCFFWVRREVFDRIGLLDESFFMYYEEAEFCRRMRIKTRYRTYFSPAASITHLGAQSSPVNSFESCRKHYLSAVQYFGVTRGKVMAGVFDVFCRAFWGVEIAALALFTWSKKWRGKKELLKSLYSIPKIIAVTFLLCLGTVSRAVPVHAEQPGAHSQMPPAADVPQPAAPSSFKAHLAGTIFRSLAKAFVAVADIEKLKRDTMHKIEAMDKNAYRRYYADIYEHTSGWGYLAEHFSVRKDMPKGELLTQIKNLDKNKLFSLVDSIPDEVIVRAYRRYARSYASQEKNPNEQASMIRIINGMIEHFRRKYCGGS